MEVIMPKMGESINEGTIIKWHKKVGDQVKRDEIIFEISTDKVDTEVPSPSSGVITEIKYNEGETVEVGTVLAVIDEKGGTPQKDTDEKKQEPKKEEPIKETPPSEEKTEITNKEQSVEENENLYPEVKSSNGNSVEILMPKMGESVMEGTILKWHKNIGDKIKKDEILFEISTDKVDTEVPSPNEGVLSEILVKENETVEVGTVVAKLSTGEKPLTQQAEERVKEDKEEVKEVESVSPPESMHDNFVQYAKSEEKHDRQNRFLSPLVMNIAQQENISFDEVNTIKGRGIGERITKKDILGYIEEKKQKKGEKKPAQQQKQESPGQKVVRTEEQSAYSAGKTAEVSSENIERIPMDNIRQKIMQHMVNSRDTSVHVSAMLEVDMTKIYNFIQKNRDKYQHEGIKLTYMPFIAQACVKALKQYPLVNSSIDGNTILRKKFINLGIAVAIEPTGLIVPNIKNADEKNITGLAKAIIELATKARTKKLSPDDITNGTFTITNYGVFGLNFGTPIINQPEVAILGVGTVIKKPVVVEYEGTDTIAIKPVMALTISHDHRLIDGMLGGLFLKFIKDTLENFDPETL